MRVLLIDDHALFREGLAGLLRRRHIDTAAAANGRDGVRQAAEFAPDVILLDLRMPEVDGLAVLEQLMRGDAPAPVVMLSTSSEQADLAEALCKGAKGYLLKDMEPDELVDALRAAAAGRTVVAPDLAPALAELVKRGGDGGRDRDLGGDGGDGDRGGGAGDRGGDRDGDRGGDRGGGDGRDAGPPAPFNQLTPRELEILRHLSEGRSNKVIARRLDISDGTVKLHVQSILRKLKVHSRVEAAVMAVTAIKDGDLRG